jgi:hypothetical protein
MPTLAVSSGVRGLQNRYGGNKRIVSVRTTTTPDTLCQLLKTYEVHMMQAAFTGLLRPPAFGSGSHISPTIQLLPNTHSYLVLHHQQVVAWVFSGVCRTQRKTDHFMDVAYIKPTLSPFGKPTGYMLDTECFETQVEALAFVHTLVQEQGVGVQV